MTHLLCARNRLFWRTSFWANGRPTGLLGWFLAGVGLSLAGHVAFLAGDGLAGFFIGLVGFVWALGTGTFALAFGQVRQEKASYDRLDALLEAYTKAIYPYGTLTFAMFNYRVRLDTTGTVVLEQEKPWAAPKDEEPVYRPLPAWMSEAADALTRVEGMRVLPTRSHFTVFADRDAPVPSKHGLLALRARVVALLPAGITPTWI